MKYLIYLFFLFCFFPYLDLFQLGTDTQPNALLLAGVLFVATNNKRVNTPLVLLWIVFFFSIFLYIRSNASVFEYLKNTLNYLSPALIATTTYFVFNQFKLKIRFKVFMIMLSVYAFVSLVQLYLIPEFMIALVNMGRGAMQGGRGVVSLTTEPAFYGTTCLFFMAFSLLNYSKQQNYYALSLLTFQVVFLSRSATAIAIFFLAIGLFTLIQLIRFRLRYLLGSMVGLLLVSTVLMSYWNKIESTRAGQLVQTFVENPLLVTKVDGSVGIRFTGTVAPFLAMRHHNFMPQGLGHYREFLTDFRRQGMYSSFLTIHRIEKKPRLSGCINMVLYQLGFIGLLFPFAIYLAFRGQLNQGAALFAFILLVVSMMTQIQMMNGMIGLIIGTAIYQGKEKRRQKVVDTVDLNHF